jgi:DNA primase
LIPDSFIERLKDASDIEQVISQYVSLKRRGGRLMGLCPFHSEKTPSFTVFLDDPHYYCFGCGSGGDVITFIKNIEHLEYIEALRLLAGRAGLVLPEDGGDDRTAAQKQRIYEMNRESARFFHGNLTADVGKPALGYLQNRGLSPKTVKRFGLGFSPNSMDSLKNHLSGKGFSWEEMNLAGLAARGRNGGYYDMFRGRVMFPIIDLRGNVIGFGGRAMDDNGPKYLNSPDTPVFKKSRNLFALNFAKAAKNGSLVLGEGYMDVIAMHQAGFTNAVATLGTSLTEEQARLISQYAKRVIIAYDSDTAGQNATKRAINLFAQLDVSVGVAEIKDAKDPDEYIKKHGAARFKHLLESGKGALDFEIAKLRQGRDLSIPEEAVAFLRDFCKLMAEVENDLERGVYIANIARELEMDKQGIVSTVKTLREKKSQQRRKKDAHNLAHAVQDNGRTREKPRQTAVSGLVAEDMLLTLLMKNPDIHETVCKQLGPEDFQDAGNREIFAVLARRLRENLPVGPTYLSQELNAGQMARLSGMLAKSRELALKPEQATQYIRAILARKDKKTSEEVREMSDEEYRRYIASLQAGKK